MDDGWPEVTVLFTGSCGPPPAAKVGLFGKTRAPLSAALARLIWARNARNPRLCRKAYAKIFWRCNLSDLFVFVFRFFFAAVRWENDGWTERIKKNSAIHAERRSMSCSLKTDGSLGVDGNHLK
jgi:hypothetical protein